MRVEFYGLKIDLPNGWTDITEDLPKGTPPSLARPMGTGTIQFSIVKYRGGEERNVTIGSLRKFLEEFCQRNHMDCNDIMEFSGNVMSVKTTSVLNGELVLAGYFSNRNDVVLVTYESPGVDNFEMDEELGDVEKIMNSIEF